MRANRVSLECPHIKVYLTHTLFPHRVYWSNNSKIVGKRGKSGFIMVISKRLRKETDKYGYF